VGRGRCTVRSEKDGDGRCRGGVGGEKDAAVVYVCGPPGMTDEFVEGLVGEGGLGMERERVLFEKWW
jgi:hypothetical protein